jgi:asparagine synthase (glutamine-hydrolysing)
MGLRVLHHHRSPGRFAVATTPHALFALSWVPRILNKDKVADTLVQSGLNGLTTYYKEIYRVLPGCIVRVQGSSLSQTRFWSPENIADVRLKNDDDYVDAFKEHLDAAVKASLRTNRPPCATITGGLDSSSIAVVASRMLAERGERLNTFTAVPEAGFELEQQAGMYFDETPFVRQIAAADPNIIPHFVSPSDRPLLEQIAQEIRIGGFSGGMLNGLWIIDILNAVRSAGHNVMLCGDLGNTTMSYHGRTWLTKLLLTGQWLRLFGEIRSSKGKWRRRIRHHLILPLFPAPLYRMYKSWRRGGRPPWYYIGALNPQFAAESGVVERSAAENFPFDVPPTRDGKKGRVEDFDCYCEMADWLASVRAAFGVDFRMPAWDRRLAEFCIGIPENQFLRDGRERWLIKRAMKDQLPDAIINNKMRGAQAADWYPRLMRERVKILEQLKGFAANAQIASVLDLPRLIRIVDSWPDEQPPALSIVEKEMLMIPAAVGAAYFVQDITGTNYTENLIGTARESAPQLDEV